MGKFSIRSPIPRIEVENLARQTQVRIPTGISPGSGTIVRQQGQIYRVLTNWQIVAIGLVTDDGLLHPLLGVLRRLDNTDLAIVLFRRAIEYKIARFILEPGSVSEPVLAVGFPAGAEVGSFADAGFVSVLLPKSLPQGYSLGSTNEVKIGMSRDPIFNAKDFLIGINCRGKYRDPNFGVYAFEDGSEPTAELLEKMVKSSWGIPISIYWQFASFHLGSYR